MRCLTYAVGKWVREGGYLLVRRSHFSRLCPHLLHMDRSGRITQFVPDHPKHLWFPPLWYKGKIKEGDK
jgi:hypothetical protein